ncbi:helix-turn-helix domain-containing protein [Lactobacillus delbrueckii subsp. lactis]|uniref:helix-turn-helix domain-containing protein n=1 Tax=Lactobacillus delbrueckii TaxID=1584 RepID=UPI0021A3730C|nr:helix-turn-helix domain-containing protein [Lactobacillus delbrueckii]MCT3515214.1 helix-turn-helix domain-containing protein [Lactobacillus delbrueckii subsp. lactis]
MNLSPRSFSKQLRINKAKKKLFNTEASIGQIAKEVGFLNQFNFTRSFKNSSPIVKLN